MALLKFVDATSPANITGGPFDGTAFYIGGDAYRVWTNAEIAAIKTRYRLPIWVRSNPSPDKIAGDISACIIVLMRIGAPKGTLIALDSETSIDPGYVIPFVHAINYAGWRVIDYGSQDDVMGNRNPDGYYWGAHWTSVPHLYSGDAATQYLSLNNEDVSLFMPTLPLWAAGDPPPPPVQPAVTQMTIILPTLMTGATDRPGQVFYVHKLQALLAQVGRDASVTAASGLAQDGIFGAATHAAVCAVQAHFALTVDGIAGPNTWTALITR